MTENEIVLDAILRFLRNNNSLFFTIEDIELEIRKNDPDFEIDKVACEIHRDCVNSHWRDYSTFHFDRYLRIGYKQYCLYGGGGYLG